MFAHQQFAAAVNGQPDDEQRKHACAEGVERQRIEPQPAAHREQGDHSDSVGQRRINHQRRKKIDLRSKQMTRQVPGRFHENGHKRHRQYKYGMKAVHGIITQTSSSPPRLAASLMRASIERP